MNNAKDDVALKYKLIINIYCMFGVFQISMKVKF